MTSYMIDFEHLTYGSTAIDVQIERVDVLDFDWEPDLPLRMKGSNVRFVSKEEAKSLFPNPKNRKSGCR